MGDVLYAATQFRTRTTREEFRHRPATVLLIDPDPATLAAMEEALRHEGFMTATAFDGLRRSTQSSCPRILRGYLQSSLRMCFDVVIRASRCFTSRRLMMSCSANDCCCRVMRK